MCERNENGYVLPYARSSGPPDDFRGWDYVGPFIIHANSGDDAAFAVDGPASARALAGALLAYAKRLEALRPASFGIPRFPFPVPLCR